MRTKKEPTVTESKDTDRTREMRQRLFVYGK